MKKSTKNLKHVKIKKLNVDKKIKKIIENNRRIFEKLAD